MKKIILIPKIKILNANALSSPYTIGFPAMTAWLGATHAIERKLRETSLFTKARFTSVAVVCHDIDLQIYKSNGGYPHSLVVTRNPLDKTGQPPSFIEAARCHLTVSLAIEYTTHGQDDEGINEATDHIVPQLKIAGGDILTSLPSRLFEIDDPDSRRRLLGQLMPGHCLIERRDLMKKAMVEGQDGIDALLDYLKVTSSCETDDTGKINWTRSRKEKGWIVPIATGFQGVSDLGRAENQRDADTPHRFAESIVTLGEFIMPYRITDLDNILWHYHTDLENNLYICQQNKPVIEN
jgi:CRISPR-associated protein Csy2